MAPNLNLEVERVLKLIPPSTDPFKFITKYIYDQYFPQLSRFSLMTLKVFFVFHMLIFISCLTILALPFLRSRKSGHWLIKRRYITDSENNKVSPQPLYLINSGVIMAMCQLFGSVSTEVYICMLIKSYHNREYRVKAQLTSCLAVIYSCEFFAYWAMAWNSLYTRLSLGTAYASRLKARKRSVIPPSIYNLIFISFPILTMIPHAPIVYKTSNAVAEESKTWFEMVNDLSLGSSVWEKMQESSTQQKAHTDLLSELMQINSRLEKNRTLTIQRVQKIISNFRVQCIFWTSVMVITLLVFVYSLAKFFSVVRETIEGEISNPQSIPTEGSSSQSRSESNKSDDALNKTRSPTTQKQKSRMMRQRFHNLAFRGGVMALSIKATIIVCVISAIKATAVATDPYWRSVTVWIALISGTIATLPITFQCWRMYRDEEVLSSKTKSEKNSREEATIDFEGLASNLEIQQQNQKYRIPDSNSTVLNITEDIPMSDFKADQDTKISSFRVLINESN